MLHLENHFLRHCRKFVLDDLMHSEKAIQEMALYRLKWIAYPGEDYAGVLTTLKASPDGQTAQVVEAILDKLQKGMSS
jgi:hypothetical protein